jgi:hypothetical protein
VVRVPGYRSRGPGSIPATTKKKVVGLERGPLSFVSTIEELLERKSSGSGLKTEITAVGDLSRLPRGTLYPQKLALTSPTSDGRSVGIFRSRTKAKEFFKITIHALYSSLEHALSLPGLLPIHQSSGNGFQRRTFLFLWVPELF